MSRMTRLLVVANRRIDSQEVCDALVERAVAGPVQVTLVASASLGAGPLCTPRTAYGEHVVKTHHRATAERMQRAVQQLRAAGVNVEDVVGEDSDPTGVVHDSWDPSRFDEIVVSCLPWLSCRRGVPESDCAGP